VGHFTAQSSGIGVLDKALQILDTVAAAPASLAELVELTDLPRATAHRLAVALEAHRLLSRDAEGRFVLGGRLRELADGASDPLVEAAGPVLSRLRDATGESAQLYIRDGSERVAIATAERASGLRTTVLLGSRLPLTAGSGAQVLVAWAPETERADLVAAAGFSMRAMADIRRRGWADSVGEREVGVASVSAPVLSEAGELIAAVSISGPIDRLGRTPGRTHGAHVLRAARELSDALGI
jgi:DNA-binding IclR family transcriptional regulator